MTMTRNGIDQLPSHASLLRGRRLGLITNPSGVNASLEATADILARDFTLTALFGPEHGIRGDAQAGDTVPDAHDPILNLPVFSLHGRSHHLSDEAFSLVDMLVYDIQDVGARFYTYLYTLAYAMADAARHHVPVAVLDRVNPVGCAVTEGPCLDADRFASFVGAYPMPTRYALTVGEYARYVNETFGLGCELHVIPCSPHPRDQLFTETGQLWVPPSPNIPTPEAALCYLGTCIFEGTNLSEGRGTTLPFQLIGAPFLDAPALARDLNAHRLPGLLFRPAHFTPTFSKFAGQLCHGVQLHVTDPHTARPFEAGIRLLEAIRLQRPGDLILKPDHLAHLLGDDRLISGAETAEQLLERARHEAEQFAEQTRPFRLYP